MLVPDVEATAVPAVKTPTPDGVPVITGEVKEGEVKEGEVSVGLVKVSGAFKPAWLIVEIAII
jgi:hypothetical protein